MDRYLEERVLAAASMIIHNGKFHKEPINLADLGCGDGRALAVMKKTLSSNNIQIAKIYAVDIDPTLVPTKGTEVLKIDLNSNQLPITDQAVDFAYSLETIEHLVRPASFINEVNRILCPKGILVVTTPNLMAWYNRILFPLGSMPIHYEVTERKKYGRLVARKGDVVHHIRVFSPRALCELLEDSGFRILSVKGLRFLFDKGSFVDSFFCLFPSLSSCFCVKAEKI